METINLKNSDINLSDLDTKELVINISGTCKIVILDNKFTSFNINMESNSNLVINHFNSNSRGDFKVKINTKDDDKIVYNMSEIIETNNNFIIYMNFEGNNSSIITNIHSLVSGKETIEITGGVKKERLNNEILENIKVLLLNDGEAKVKPNMLIDTNLVNAFHKVAISSINKNYLFYLNSKGISESSSIDLIKKSFLLSNISDESLKLKIADYGGE